MAENSTPLYQDRTYIKVIPPMASTARDHQPSKHSNNPQFHINLKFSGTHSLCAVLENYIDTFDVPLPQIRFVFHLQQFLRRKEALETIAKKLEFWPFLTGRQRQLLAELALLRAQLAVLGMPASHNVVQIDYRVNFVQERYFELGQATSIDRVIERSMDGVRMVPADESSIESLESKKIVSTAGACAVCMEEFPGGEYCEVVSMPCLHVFHGDCIKKWLRTSHYCPVCRFEMPTS